MKQKEDTSLARERIKKFKEGLSVDNPSPSNEIGKIILLCGTSTAGKTSICTAAQIEAQKAGHAWVIDGADVASEKVWTQPSEINGKKYASASDHFVNAIKTYVNSSVVDSAVRVFGARTLVVAVFSRQHLGNPKVDQVDLTPEKDIKEQAIKIYNTLSFDNKKQYTPDSIKHLLMIIQDCPGVAEFLDKHPYPPSEKLNELMLEQAIIRAKKGESTLLDIVGNETINDKRMVDIFQNTLKASELPDDTGTIALVHCPINTLIDRIDSRNKEALSQNRQADLRLSFFPFNQYGGIYERAPNLLESEKPILGEVSRLDIIKAADKFGRGKEDATALLNKLGFNDNEETVSVISTIQNDITFQSGKLSPQEMAYQLCERAFEHEIESTYDFKP